MSLSNKGFSFIEVLLALVIFVMAAITAVNLTKGSVRAVREARELSVATWLLEKQMVELETKIELTGFEKACEKKSEGKFEGEFSKYRWVAYCDEIDFKLSETAAQMAAKEDEDNTSGSTTENLILKTILNMASDYISKSMRELHVEVLWEQNKETKTVDATTHLVRLDQPVTLPTLTTGSL